MRNLMLAAALGGLGVSLTPAVIVGQRGRTPQYVTNLESKLAEPWVRNALWITDLAAAKAIAAREGKHIFAYITRSYAP